MVAGSWDEELLESMLDSVELVAKTRNDVGALLPHYVGRKGTAEFVFMQRHGHSGNGDPVVTPAELVNPRFPHSYESLISELTHGYDADAVFGFSRVGVFDKHKGTWPLIGDGYFIIPNDNFPYRDAPFTFGKSEQDGFGAKIAHPSMSPAYDASLQGRLVGAVRAAGGTALTDGLYIYVFGNTFEHEAEVRVCDRLTDGIAPYRVVGMTTYPELKLCKEMGTPYAALTLPVNPVVGFDEEIVVSHEQTNAESAKAKKMFRDVLEQLVTQYQ